MDRRSFLKKVGGASAAAVSAPLLISALTSPATAETVQQIECPYPNDPYVTSAQTQEGAAVRFIEHVAQTHPGGLPPAVAQPLQAVLDNLKGRYK